MKKPKKSTVKYIAGVHQDKDGIIKLDHSSKNVNSSMVKRYHGLLELLIPMSPCERRLLDYLTEKMPETNIVHSDKHTREMFQKSVYFTIRDSFMADGLSEKEATARALKESYADISIRKAFGQLEKKGLLIKKTRGVFWVNPEFFFKASDAKRLKMLEVTLGIQKGVSYVMLKRTKYELE